MQTDPETLLPLTSAVFNILLALADGERHGYSIMQEIAAQTQGKLRIAPTTLLYRWLLSLGPEAFRCDYATPALQDFRQCCLDAYQEQGSFGVLRLWPGLLRETVIGLLAEYLTEIFGRKRPMLSTIRRSMIVAFWAFVLFIFA